MNNVDISTIQPSEIAEIFLEMSNEEIRLATAHLNPEQLSTVISYMNEKYTPHWKGKIRAIILGLSNHSQLEVAGRSLSIPQILDFFESPLLSREDGFNKLLAILVGMNSQTFEQLLKEISDDQLQVLLQTSFSEPLQHHITVFIHEMNHRYLLHSEELNKLLREIENLSLENLGRNDLMALKTHIHEISLLFIQSLEKMKNALRIAWNTHRSDLVESLNAVKDKYLHTLNNFIGHSENSQGATGLYELLGIRLNQVFGNPYDLNDSESLDDHEPAIEALVKFSIWYLKDYWEVGLLPTIESEKQLELDSQEFNDLERSEYRDKLFSEVQHNLEKLQLKTLSDLKKEHIYSKKGLIEYIQEKQVLR